MNLEQLNGSGQSIKTFIITLVTALAITGLAWYSVETINRCLAWYKRIVWTEDDRNQEFSLSIRLFMIFWLISNGYLAWMWRTGAGLRLLLDSNDRLIVQGPEHLSIPRNLSACGYVSYLIGSSSLERIHGFNFNGFVRFERQR